MSDVRSFGADRAAIAEAVHRRVGGDARVISEMLDGIAGDFSAPLHRAVIGLLPSALGRAFGGAFRDRVTVEGDLESLRDLATRATIILAPTHSSNLDSIVLGLVTARGGLPPFAYAAGKHIFRNPLFATLMHRLGAFCLDPDRRERLYLRVVQVYVNELIARGYHTVVFPSGTRCRSGEVESTIKLGLLRAAVHVDRPIAIVPVTINYQIVLEAETLIAYYMAGRSHERIVGDELFTLARLADTTRRLAKLDQRVVISFGEPIDPRAGEGPWRPRVTQALTAAYRRGTVFFATHIVARALQDLVAARVWTAVRGALGDVRVAEIRRDARQRQPARDSRGEIAFLRAPVRIITPAELAELDRSGDVRAAHDRCTSELDRLRARDPRLARVRTLGASELLPLEEVRASIIDTRARLAADPDAGQVWAPLLDAAPDEILGAALTAWDSWHRSPPAILSTDKVIVTDPGLVLFYRNRTWHVPSP